MPTEEILCIFWGPCLLICAVLGAAKRYGGHLGCLKERDWLRARGLPCCLLGLLLWSVLSFFFAEDKNLGLWGAYLCREGLVLFFFYGAIFLSFSWLAERRGALLCRTLVLTGAFTGVLLILCENPTVCSIFYMVLGLSYGIYRKYRNP